MFEKLLPENSFTLVPVFVVFIRKVADESVFNAIWFSRKKTAVTRMEKCTAAIVLTVLY